MVQGSVQFTGPCCQPTRTRLVVMCWKAFRAREQRHTDNRAAVVGTTLGCLREARATKALAPRPGPCPTGELQELINCCDGRPPKTSYAL